MIRKFCLLIATWIFVVSAQLHGEVIISVDSGGGLVAETGSPGPNKTIDLFLSQTAGSSDQFAGNTGDFDFAAGTVSSVTIGSEGAAADNGFLGEGNLGTSTTEITGGGSSFNFNQFYTNLSQPIASAPDGELWMTIEIDTTGLADGTYAIDLRPDTSGNFLDDVGNVVGSNASLFFVVDSAAGQFLLGDVNLDGVVSFLDIAPFIGLLTSNSFQLEADIDGNGVVSFLDIAPFIGLLSAQ
jgi:hypothetical protein